LLAVASERRNEQTKNAPQHAGPPAVSMWAQATVGVEWRCLQRRR
jgi:hypothetical protein